MRNLQRLSCIGTATFISLGVLAGCGGGPSDGTGGSGSASVGGNGNPNIGGNGNPGSGSTSSTGGGANNGGGGPAVGGGSNGGAGVGGGGAIEPEVCVPGVPATSQIPRLAGREYDNAVSELLGVTTVGAQGQKASELLLGDTDGSLDAYAWTAYMTTADTIASQVMKDAAKKAKFISCDPAGAQCLTDTIKAFGRKAFRRPVTDEEVAEFMKFNSLTPAPTSADEVAEAVLFAFLISPSFITLPELDKGEMEGTAVKLNDFEVAVRLSIGLWGSLPDEILTKAADDGLLNTKEQILEQAKRMVGDKARTSPLVTAFHHSYFEMGKERWNTAVRDPELYPEFTEAAHAAGAAEVDAIVEDIAFNNGKFKDLFLSNVGYVNNATAPIYDLPAADYTAELKRVELDAEKRPGILTRTGFLTAYAGPKITNPIMRGVFVVANMMGISTGIPSDGATQTPDPDGPFMTVRDMIDEKTSGACAECHASKINPPGYVLEKYNAIGAWQDVDNWGGPITGAADVVVNENAQGLTIKSIASPKQLMEEIGNGQRSQWNYVQKWIGFTTGRLANTSDNCTVLDLGAKLAGEYTILNLLTDLTQTDSFRARTTAL